MKTPYNRFRKGSGCFKCQDCGKMTRDTEGGNGDLRMCAECYDYAGWENTHSDNNHKAKPDADCPVCKKEGAKPVWPVETTDASMSGINPDDEEVA